MVIKTIAEIDENTFERFYLIVENRQIMALETVMKKWREKVRGMYNSEQMFVCLENLFDEYSIDYHCINDDILEVYKAKA